MTENILPSLYVGLSAWVIQDGNYADFYLGQRARFALEFFPYSLRPTYSRSKWAEHLAASRYRVWGQVIYCTEQVWVLDMGFRAYQEARRTTRIFSAGLQDQCLAG